MTLRSVLALSLSLLFLQACSLSTPEQRRVRLEIPPVPEQMAKASQKQPGDVMKLFGLSSSLSSLGMVVLGGSAGTAGSSSDTPPTSLDDMTCFAINVSGSGIARDGRMFCKNEADFIGISGGMVSATAGGIIDLMVPTGSERRIQLMGFKTAIGCPSMDAVFNAAALEQNGGPSMDQSLGGHVGPPWFLGETSVAITDDTTVTIQAKYDPATPIELFQSCGKPSSPGGQVASLSMVTANPPNVVADGVATSTITVMLHDSNPRDFSGHVVRLVPNRSGDIISPATQVTTATGIAMFTVSSTNPGSVEFSVIDDTEQVTLNYKAWVNFTAPSGASVDFALSSLTANPTTVAADNASFATVTVTVRDGSSYPISGKTVTLTSSREATVDSISDGGVKITGFNGVAQFTIKSASVGSSTLTAWVDGTALTNSAVVNFVATSVSVANSTVTPSMTTVVADGTIATTITVVLKDSSNTALSGKTVTLTSSLMGVTVNPASGVSDSWGTVLFTATSTRIGNTLFTAVADSATVSAQSPVNFVAGAPFTSSSLHANPAIVAAVPGASATVTVVLKDAYSNPISGKTVSLTSDRTGSDIVTAIQAVTDSGGKAYFSISSTALGSPILTATVPVSGSPDFILASASAVQFVAGPPVAAQSMVQVVSGTGMANLSAAATALVTLKDNSGRPVQGKLVSLSSDRTADLITSSGASDANGQVSFTIKTTLAGAATFTATVMGDNLILSPQPSLTFTAGAAHPSVSTVTSSSSAVPLGQNATIIVRLLDNYSNPISGAGVSLSASGGAVSINPVSGAVTNSNGTVQFTVSSSTAAPVTFTATVIHGGTVVLASRPSVTFGGTAVVDPALSTITASSPYLPASGGAVTLTVTLKDSAYQPVSGKPVQILSTGGSMLVDGMTPGATQQTTNANGEALFTVNSSLVETSSFWAKDVSSGIELRQRLTLTSYSPGLSITPECWPGYVRVPGNPSLGTVDFCVSKFPMKAVASGGALKGGGDGVGVWNGSGYSSPWSVVNTFAESRPDGTPWTWISRDDARQACAAQGAHLVTNAEWQTIAWNIETVPQNWTDNTVRGGSLFVGHTDSTLASSAYSAQLSFGSYPLVAASSSLIQVDDLAGYLGTGNSSSFGEAQRRTLFLSNGAVLWDFSGNVNSWVDLDLLAANYGAVGTTITADQVGGFALRDFGTQLRHYEDFGFGQIKINPGSLVAGGSALFRGSNYSDTAGAGAFAAFVGVDPGYASFAIGFRCALPITAGGSIGSGKQMFLSAGASSSFVVPAGVTQLNLKLWGAGGGAGFDVNGGVLYAGGGGAAVAGILAVSQGEVLTLRVGKAGQSTDGFSLGQGGWPNGGNGGYSVWEDAGAGGGGSSAIFRGGILLAEAGGGGGGVFTIPGSPGRGFDCSSPVTEFGQPGGSGQGGGGGGYCAGGPGFGGSSFSSLQSWSAAPGSGPNPGFLSDPDRGNAGFSEDDGRIVISW